MTAKHRRKMVVARIEHKFFHEGFVSPIHIEGKFGRLSNMHYEMLLTISTKYDWVMLKRGRYTNEKERAFTAECVRECGFKVINNQGE